MLRALVVGLILLNALFFSWTRGWLDTAIGIKARGDREPERLLSRPLHPERIQVLTAQTAAKQVPVCVTLGPLDGDAALATATAALAQAGLKPGDWQERLNEQAGVWAVATIRMPSKEFQARKEATYKSMNLPYQFLSGPAEELPTLVLSRHTSEKAANTALENYAQRALKGLRVLNLQAAAKRYSLVFAQADGPLQARLAGLGPVTPCAVPAPAAAASAPLPPASAPSASPG